MLGIKILLLLSTYFHIHAAIKKTFKNFKLTNTVKPVNSRHLKKGACHE